MRKILFTILFIFSVSLLFAQYTVTEVRGQCDLETSPNVWRPIRVGESLTGHTVVRVMPNSFLVFEDRERKIYIIGGDTIQIGLIADILFFNSDVRLYIRDRIPTSPDS